MGTTLSTSSAFTSRRSVAGHLKSEYDVHPKACVLAAKALHSRETLYLIRLREDWDSLHSYHLKTLVDLEELDKELRAAYQSTPAQDRVLHQLPIMPERSRFGLRGQLSKLGFGRFLDRQHEGVQQYIDTLLNQVPVLCADYHIQQFFQGVRTADEKALLRTMLLECRAGISLKSLQGHWRQSSHTWTIEASGKALLDGVHRGAEYDLMEQGQGLQMTISRADGWKVDIERSTTTTLFWCKQGNADLEWMRIGSERDRKRDQEQRGGSKSSRNLSNRK